MASSRSSARQHTAAATQSILDAIHALSLIMAVVPIAAIVAATVLIKPSAPKRAATAAD